MRWDRKGIHFTELKDELCSWFAYIHGTTFELNELKGAPPPVSFFLFSPSPHHPAKKKSAYSWCLNAHPKIELSSRCSCHEEHLPKAGFAAFGCVLLQSRSWSPFSSNIAGMTSSPDLPGTTQDKGTGSLKMECGGSNGSHQDTGTPRSRE